MAVDQAISAGPWPAGATVSLYARRSGQPVLDQPAPPGAALVGTATVAGDLSVTFTGLPVSSGFWAVGQDSSGRWRWVDFRTPDAEPGSTPAGPSGPMGPAGPKGDTGAQGPGGTGPQGPKGNDGSAIAVIRGRVNADGTIAAGSGFSVTRNAGGDYTVTFSAPFATEAVPQITPMSVAQATDWHLTAVGVSSFRVIFYVGFSAGSPVKLDTAFTFVAVAS